MRLDARTIFTAMLMASCAPLAGCGSQDKGGNSIQMKDMEVVDGTATDAMTDLDGVQSEGTTLTLPANKADNASTAAPKAATAPEAKEASEDSEVVSDQ